MESTSASGLDRFFRHGGLALLIMLIGGAGLLKSSTHNRTLLRGFDAQFYYAAARSAAVGGDWDVTDDLPLSPAPAALQSEHGVPRRPDGGVKNIFPVGLSLVESAVLIPSRVLADHAGESDRPAGYRRLEVLLVAVGLLLIAAVGLQLMYGFTRLLAPPSLAASAILLAWVGTPLLYYTAWFPFSVHPTTFAIMAMLLLVADRMPRQDPANGGMILFGTLAALLYLTRPHQTPYVVLLAAWRFPPILRRPMASWLPGALGGIGLCLAAMGFQAYLHHLNTGSWGLIAHGLHDHPAISGRFQWDDPSPEVVLLSPTRGLLWITPLVGLSLLGFVLRLRSVPWWGWASLVNAIIQTTILAFWSDPGQGDSFGIRLWCEHVPVVVCGMALLMNGRMSRPTFVLAMGCVAWTLLMAATYVPGKLRPGMSHGDVVRQFRRFLPELGKT